MRMGGVSNRDFGRIKRKSMEDYRATGAMVLGVPGLAGRTCPSWVNSCPDQRASGRAFAGDICLSDLLFTIEKRRVDHSLAPMVMLRNYEGLPTTKPQ